MYVRRLELFANVKITDGKAILLTLDRFETYSQGFDFSCRSHGHIIYLDISK